VGPKAENIISEAIDKVSARHQAGRAPGTPVPFEQFVREVIAEASAEAGNVNHYSG
jgi:hypothetical protein